MAGRLVAIAALALALALQHVEVARADSDIAVAPASIGSDVPITYFGPPPSSVDPKLVGPVQLLKSGTIDDTTEPATITLPLYYGYTIRPKTRGSPAVKIPFYYIVTDTSDSANAAGLGINLSGKLKYALQPNTYRSGQLDSKSFLVTSNGWVDFKPARSVTPGAAPNFFPPRAVQPGSVGVDGYSPLVTLGGEVYNAPIVADGTNLQVLRGLCNNTLKNAAGSIPAIAQWVHDKVVNLCLNDDGFGGTVTIKLTNGFSFAKPVLYVSLDAFPAIPAALEAVTLSYALGNITVGNDDSLFSGVERLFALTNGHSNADIPAGPRADGPKETRHPLRQGFNSALRGEGDPLNVLGGIPTVATDYSPIWDVNMGEWTPYAVKAGYRTRMFDEFQYLGNVQRGYITAPGGGAFGSSGAVVNCPIVKRFL